MTVKPIKFGNSLTPFPFLSNGVEWNGVVQLKVFLGLMEIYGQEFKDISYGWK